VSWGRSYGFALILLKHWGGDNMALTKEDSVAVHEAAHVVMLIGFDKEFDYVTITPNEVANGYYHRFTPDFSGIATTQEFALTVLNEIIISLAGVMAEWVILKIEPEQCFAGGVEDFKQVEALLEHIHTSKREDFRKIATDNIIYMLQQPSTQRKIEAVVKGLKDNSTLSYDQVINIIKSVEGAA
jgi:hypothetical protein